jgi:NTE family protein
MPRRSLIFSLLVVCLCCFSLSEKLSAQRVGVVLSGGGATAAAHVGFLKALEEEGIPIDYITGTSMGALIGALYASGYSANQIDSIVQSEAYLNMSQGILNEEFMYYFKLNDPSASMGTLKFSKGNFIASSIPTNLIDPVVIDYDFMEVFSPPAAASNYDFDSLFIPFRCPASDIESKKEVVFRKGQLGMAVRASMTYPFYLKPIRIDGKLMFDGGLYNNYPANIMYYDFLPDVIIGCNVSENELPPEEDDLMSLLKNMILYKTNFESSCEQTVLVQPISEVGTFDFDRMGEAISDGYRAAKEQMEEIKGVVIDRRNPEELALSRKKFRDKCPPLSFNEISISGLDKSQKSYVNKILGKGQNTIGSAKLKDRYFRIFADDKIKYIYPIATYSSISQQYKLHLNVEKEKDVFLDVGGNFSSRAINTAYIGLKYNMFGKISGTIKANSYFGKYYGSLLLSTKFDFSTRLPFSIEPHIIFNRWDYFRSFATFFEDVQPSFIVIDERYAGIKLRFPVRSSARIDIESAYTRIADDYYQQENFLATDTADRTVLNGVFSNLTFERSTLNRKQFASQGTCMETKLRFLVQQAPSETPQQI